MSATTTRRVTGEYVLATGKAGARRLRILHEVYGPDTRAMPAWARMAQLWARKP